ncbi:MAG TPA: cytochrome c [Bacteroidia bacterium]
MKLLLSTISVAFLISIYSVSSAQSGEQIFKTVCATCHTVGKGKLVGPDLKDVDQRHDEAWMLKWVKSSQTMVKEGDPVAVKLFNDNNKIPMPDQPTYNDEQIKSVFAYIKTKGAEVATQPAATAETASATPHQSSSLFSTFSFTEYLLLGLMVIMLIIIWVLSRTIRNLSMEIADKFSNNK